MSTQDSACEETHTEEQTQSVLTWQRPTLEGALVFAAVLPVGGFQVSNDIAVGLRTPFAAAEEIKIRHGYALPELLEDDRTIDVSSFDTGDGRPVSRRQVSEIIEPRLEETFELVLEQLEKASLRGLPAGVVLTNRRGEFKIEELAEGDVILEAYAPDVGRGRVTGVHVTAGRTTDRVRIAIGAGEPDPTLEPAGAAGVAVSLDDKGSAGVRVGSVANGSEAEKAGLLAGDGDDGLQGPVRPGPDHVDVLDFDRKAHGRRRDPVLQVLHPQPQAPRPTVGPRASRPRAAAEAKARKQSQSHSRAPIPGDHPLPSAPAQGDPQCPGRQSPGANFP